MLQDYVSTYCYIKLTKAFADAAQRFIQSDKPNENAFYARLVSVESVGVMIENPRWSTGAVSDTKRETNKIAFLVPWGALISIGVFPEGGFSEDGFPQELENQQIGFHSNRPA